MPAIERGVIAIPKCQFEGFMREIKAMKPRKRKNWKNYLWDRWGTRTSCKYRDGKIYNWSLLTNRWEEVICLRDDLSQVVARSRLGRMLKAGVPFDVAFPLETALNEISMNEDHTMDLMRRKNEEKASSN